MNSTVVWRGCTIGMMAYDVMVILDNRPGELARLGEVAGAAGVNIDGFAAFTGEGKGVVHVLFADDRLETLIDALMRAAANCAATWTASETPTRTNRSAPSTPTGAVPIPLLQHCVIGASHTCSGLLDTEPLDFPSAHQPHVGAPDHREGPADLLSQSGGRAASKHPAGAA